VQFSALTLDTVSANSPPPRLHRNSRVDGDEHVARAVERSPTEMVYAPAAGIRDPMRPLPALPPHRGASLPPRADIIDAVRILRYFLIARIITTTGLVT